MIRILHDPSVLPPDYGKTRRDERQNRTVRTARRGRTEVVAALAIAEEEKQSRQLKSLLRSSGERLEYEIRRAEAATQRGEIAERQEKTYLARALSAETEKEEVRKICNSLERDMRNYQIQLEAAQRELDHLLMDLGEKKREMEELQDGEAKAQGEARKCRSGMNELQARLEKQNVEVQTVAQEWYESGREAGYEEGYNAGRKEGVKKGRREGLAEGKHEERRNAMEDLAKDTIESQGKVDRIRRWAQSIYPVD